MANEFTATIVLTLDLIVAPCTCLRSYFSILFYTLKFPIIVLAVHVRQAVLVVFRLVLNY